MKLVARSSLDLHLVRGGEACLAEDEIHVLFFLQPAPGRAAEPIDDVALPLPHLHQIDRDLAGRHAVVRGTTGEVRDPLATMVLVGVHPCTMQLPPTLSARSTTAVFRPERVEAAGQGVSRLSGSDDDGIVGTNRGHRALPPFGR